MVRLRRPPEWGVEPVPMALRVLRTFDLFVLWSSLGVGLLVLAAGTLLIGVGGFGFGLTLAESAVVAFVGSGVMARLIYTLWHVAYKGKSIAVQDAIYQSVFLPWLRSSVGGGRTSRRR